LNSIFFFAEEAPFNTAFSPKDNSFNQDLQKNSPGGSTTSEPGVKSKDPDPGWVKTMIRIRDKQPNHIS
jgi:hypothetical protein